MTRRKNTTRIDPRYFLNETTERSLDEQDESDDLQEDEDINEADWKPGKVTPGGSQGAYADTGGRGGMPGKAIPQGDVQKIAAATTAGSGETADKDIDDIRRSGAKEFGLAGKRESLTRSRLRQMVMEELKNLK